MPPIRVAGVGDEPGLQDKYNALPVCTKFFLTGLVLSAAFVQFNFVSEMKLVYLWQEIWQRFEIWRFVTPFIFVGGFGLPFVMHTYMMCMNMYKYELNPFNTGAGGTSADVIYMLLFGLVIFCLLDAYLMNMLLAIQMLYMVVYVWSRRDPNSLVKIFIITVKAVYVPWVYVAIAILMGQSIKSPLIGIAVGHVYFFLADVYPRTGGFEILRTPQFCSTIAAWNTGNGIPPGTPQGVPGTPFRPTGAGSVWGRGGRTLGSS